MKAIWAVKNSEFKEIETEIPQLNTRDVLVKVLASSVNPVDTKVHEGIMDQGMILGYDAVGTVTKVGSDVKTFKKGDKVYYAGSNVRNGSNAEFQAVDARLISKAPQQLSISEAAALPLTSITAWELLFERLNVEPIANGNSGTILIINGAGGVGSILTQLAKWAGLTVIATASRPETQEWVSKMGADQVINHRVDLREQLDKNSIDYAVILHSTDQYLPILADLVVPEGKIASIVENTEPLPMGLLKDKSIGFEWEFMFTKPKYQVNMTDQGQILKNVAQLLDDGVLKTTMTQELSGLNPETLERAHEIVKSNKMIGKLVIKY
ncbi:zinc-binding alcohol dehydrogenase family protein [Pediococcus claussenii]|uniref:Zinc-type alcohol dehydrogenase-like protein n=1 Tax=Pediococcus claussenii (strain ATCC BAA-344 / DSM 14800 / JCM 18046 / KCTC 3811 / LMG 21948 / P06) TaxID=701521 RepID=G8PCJ0_PEDCP|nr:zinc-binding alcohol dehydrogenase family protein [Pediococcus claussenii]AEV94975.1 zinc-binding alcohol dehydrogenase family protein [Pediococcus claussenii ATCC BAA-344]ANZ70164.1 alcohol dehydrogenase [Pediococcus claussenii]ANZ71980.1 alcohol dehydrogenase [Pediococcus claussenii]KRN19223.1 hypothetical protein IV79_GL001595 [Pediococcus claussenii]